MEKIVNGVYYNSEGKPSHAGAVKIDGKIYYAGKDGVIAKKQERIIHHGMANGLTRHGRYYFDKDGVIDLSSYKEVKSSRKQRKKKKKLSEKDKKVVFAVTLVFILIFIAVIGGAVYTAISSNSSANKTSNNGGDFAVSFPEYEDQVYLCSDSMVNYYKGEQTLLEAMRNSGAAYKSFEFTYSISNAKSAYFRLINIDDNSTLVGDYLDLESTSYSIDNLMADTTYKYIVSTVDLDGQEHFDEGTFKTADTNRFISLPGVYNTRDIGGYDTVFGKKVKQGILIRGSELDGLVESKYYLKDVDAVKPFGFKCDFDLRNKNIFNSAYESRLGSDVSHRFYNSPAHSSIFSKGNESYLKQIFTDLADSSNYPMYMHCTYGTDRTGTIVFLLQGLLGVSEEDMKNEYILSGFFDSNYADVDNLNPIMSGLQGASGSTINEKVENYLKDTAGITQGQIDSIRSIFLED